MRLAKNFTLDEFTRSANATRRGIDNSPTPEHLENLKRLAVFVQMVRDFLGVPMTITSGYRSPQLNAVTPGSSNTSDHSNGLAIDFVAPAFGTPLAICKALVDSGIAFDQLIYEQGVNGDWVHIGFGQRMRQQVMSKAPNRPYINGLVVR